MSKTPKIIAAIALTAVTAALIVAATVTRIDAGEQDVKEAKVDKAKLTSQAQEEKAKSSLMEIRFGEMDRYASQGKYGSYDDLAAGPLAVVKVDTAAVVTDDAGACFVAVSASPTGVIYYANQDTDVTELTTGPDVSAGCDVDTGALFNAVLDDEAADPLTPDETAKADAESLHIAATVHYVETERYGSYDDLVAGGLVTAKLATADVATDAAGSCFVAAATSTTGRTYYVNAEMGSVAEYKTGDDAGCGVDLAALVTSVGGH